MTAIPFVKMHGIGNDYVYLDAFTDPALATMDGLPVLARAVSDRHTGIGADGLILVCQPSEPDRAAGADVAMRMFNADGSESAMCGNGVRCVAKFASDRLGFDHRLVRVHTPAGILAITCTTDSTGRVQSATVDMGTPVLDAARVPVTTKRAPFPGGRAVDVPAEQLGIYATNAAGLMRAVEPLMTCLSMGNPHAVLWCKDPAAIDLTVVGPLIEQDPMFPERINVHFARCKSSKSVVMRTWERGSGITMACGTGACAVAVAGALTRRLGRTVNAQLPGGTLNVHWDDSTNHVMMTGPAADVFTGTWVLGGTAATSSLPPPPLAGVPTLTTPHLLLRQATHADAPAIATLGNDRRVSDMLLTMPFPYAPADAHGWISKGRAAHTRGEFSSWVITLAQTGDVIGCIGIHPGKSLHRHAEAGYWIGVPHWGKGYATEALKAVLTYAFTQRHPALDSVFAHHFPSNPASGRVMIKAGMIFEAVCPQFHRKNGAPSDVVRYAISSAAWHAAAEKGATP